ncbi:MAG TPA: FkbM family methyltransferase [Polyangia bacterium]|nr:FkbM family methyltransferase [Polyangia bacterium]
MHRDLIFDIGMHSGVDTEFYLKKGFRVVGVEANPSLSTLAEKKFATAIADGRLCIEAVGISNVEKIQTFYVNEDCDEWSSFLEEQGTRQNSRFRTLEVPCKRLDYLVEKYGMPYYLKIDVEGLDSLIVRDLSRLKERPKFISIEEGNIESLIALYEAGVRSFNFINQLAIREFRLPSPAREGHEVEHRFGASSSGPFGRELPGEWLYPERAFKHYLDKVHPPDSAPIDGWWDIHGRFLNWNELFAETAKSRSK